MAWSRKPSLSNSPWKCLLNSQKAEWWLFCIATRPSALIPHSIQGVDQHLFSCRWGPHQNPFQGNEGLWLRLRGSKNESREYWRVCCEPMVRMRVFKFCVEKNAWVHEIAEVKHDHRSCHVGLVKWRNVNCDHLINKNFRLTDWWKSNLSLMNKTSNISDFLRFVRIHVSSWTATAVLNWHNRMPKISGDPVFGYKRAFLHFPDSLWTFVRK